MKIEKFVKDKGNKYNVYIDGEAYKLYDDIIVKYSLGLKKEIDEDIFKEVMDENDKMKAYYLSIKYLTNKLRCEKEIVDFLKKHEIDDNNIKDTVDKLKEQGYLNKDIYLKAFINDAINLSYKGPDKIKNELNKLGFKNDEIDEYLDKYNNDFWENRINNYINNKINLNKTKSSYAFKNKMLLDLKNLGYNREAISTCLDSVKIDDKDAYRKEYDNAYKKYSKKYEGFELDQKVKMYLYRKGFKIGDCYED